MDVVHFLDESHIFLFLVQFFLLLGCAKLLGILFTKIKQSTITADILVGIILGPTVLGRFFPEFSVILFPNDVIQRNMLETLGWIGIFFLLLVTGLEVNFSSVWKQRNQALKISLADILIPIGVAFIPIYFLSSEYLVYPEKRLLFTIFLSTIMTISAMPVAIRAMRDLKIMQTDMGFLVISALSINDVIGWIIFTIILGLFSQTSLNISYIFQIIVLTLSFTAFALIFAKNFVSRAITYIKNKTYDDTAHSLTFIVLLGLLFGAITQKIGIHALFGFFIAGLIAGESKDLSENTRNTIIKIVYAVFVPIFFANIGLKIDIAQNIDFFLVCFITGIGILARLLGAYVGTLWAKTPSNNRWIIAILHTPGGEMHIVISTIAIELGLITKEVYVAIIAGAIISSLTLGPWLSYVLRKKSLVSEKIKDKITFLFSPLESQNKKEAIEELCRNVSNFTKIDYDKILDAVFLREEQFSTAIGKGIAIPHARMIELQEPIVVFSRNSIGIDWNAIDNKPVHIIFMVLTPMSDKDVQLQIYSKIARALMKEIVREELLKAKKEENIYKILEKIFEE